MAVAVDDKAFSPSCMLRSKLGVTVATAVDCWQNFMLKRPTAAVVLHLAVHQLQHAAQHQHHHVDVQLQRHHHVVVQLQQLHHVVVQLHAVVVLFQLQFRPDAALAEQQWMLAQSAPRLPHQPFQQHRLATKLQQRKLFEPFAIWPAKARLQKYLITELRFQLEFSSVFSFALTSLQLNCWETCVVENCFNRIVQRDEKLTNYQLLIPAALPVKQIKILS